MYRVPLALLVTLLLVVLIDRTREGFPRSRADSSVNRGVCQRRAKATLDTAEIGEKNGTEAARPNFFHCDKGCPCPSEGLARRAFVFLVPRSRPDLRRKTIHRSGGCGDASVFGR